MEALAVAVVLAVGGGVYWFTIGRKPPVGPDGEAQVPSARVVETTYP